MYDPQKAIISYINSVSPHPTVGRVDNFEGDAPIVSVLMAGSSPQNYVPTDRVRVRVIVYDNGSEVSNMIAWNLIQSIKQTQSYYVSLDNVDYLIRNVTHVAGPYDGWLEQGKAFGSIVSLDIWITHHAS